MEKPINAMPAFAGSVLAVCFVILIGWQALSIQNDDGINDRQRSDASPAEDNVKAPAQSVELKELTFFGEPGEQTTPRVAETEDLPETNLQLVLRGVMAGGDSGRESALIEGPNAETEVYHPDESLPGNAVLLKVYDRRIVIQRAGELETLSFPRDDSSEKLAVAGSAGNRGERDRDRDEPGSTQRARNSDDVRSRLKKLRERLRND